MEVAGEVERLLATARGWEGAPLAIATVTSTWGSAPRPRGSHMLVHVDGRFEGSVSGGCVEGEVLAAAAEAIADRQARRLAFDVSEETAWAASLPCGGAIEVLVQPVGDDGYAPHLFVAWEEARAEGQPFAVTTNLASGLSRIGEEPGEDRFVNVKPPRRRLLIVGAVQIALPLAGFARALEYDVTIVDPRDRFRTDERFPGVALDDRWPDEAIGALKPNSATAVVTLSHDPKIDDPALIAALASPARYIAALGSTRSHAARRSRLAAAGVEESAMDRIDAPAGLAIGALGPAEIALSIAAGMIKAFRQD